MCLTFRFWDVESNIPGNTAWYYSTCLNRIGSAMRWMPKNALIMGASRFKTTQTVEEKNSDRMCEWSGRAESLSAIGHVQTRMAEMILGMESMINTQDLARRPTIFSHQCVLQGCRQVWFDVWRSLPNTLLLITALAVPSWHKGQRMTGLQGSCKWYPRNP